MSKYELYELKQEYDNQKHEIINEKERKRKQVIQHEINKMRNKIFNKMEEKNIPKKGILIIEAGCYEDFYKNVRPYKSHKKLAEIISKKYKNIAINNLGYYHDINKLFILNKNNENNEEIKINLLEEFEKVIEKFMENI